MNQILKPNSWNTSEFFFLETKLQMNGSHWTKLMSLPLLLSWSSLVATTTTTMTTLTLSVSISLPLQQQLNFKMWEAFCKILVYLSMPICSNSNSLTFQDVQQGLADNSISLIDVRTALEVETLGKIPTAHNLPSRWNFCSELLHWVA